MWKIIKTVTIILFLLGVLAFSLWEIQSRRDASNIEQIIDSITSKIDSIKVENITLVQKNDSIQVRIVEVERTYEENTNTILANSVSDDYIFFSEYVARYNDSNYTKTAKNS